MLAREPSRTALGAAAHRAAHQMDGAQLFSDPLAIKIVGEDNARESHAAAGNVGMRIFIAARSRFAEDTLAESLARGVTQLVVLGAGLDTYAYRGANRAKLQIYEVDHPATQAWKRERLAAIGVEADANVHYAPVDFENERIGDGLARAGFDPNQRTFFFWLGVVPYLTRAAIDASWALIADNPGGGEVIFDYAMSRDAMAPEERAMFDALTARVAAAGEPFLTYFDPATLPHELRDAGFAKVNDLTIGDILAKHFPNMPRSNGRGHIVHAMTR
ncbi:MAG: SAM-dependent methyltransferase [Terricaulis sp.]